MTDLAVLTNFACTLADAARQETLPRFGIVAASDKGEGGYDPVTAADIAAEDAMCAMIVDAYPDHGISGEERGERASAGAYRWSLDPIDGTRSYICGLPTWVTLIALLQDDAPVIGVIDVPRLDERYVGSANGSFLHSGGEATALRTSACASLAEARLSSTDPGLFDRTNAEAFARVRAACPVVRYGHDGYAYARLAAGTIDLVVEAGLKPYDLMALIPVVRAAGGVIGDWQGGSDFAQGRVVAAASQALFDQAVRMLAS